MTNESTLESWESRILAIMLTWESQEQKSWQSQIILTMMQMYHDTWESQIKAIMNDKKDEI